MASSVVIPMFPSGVFPTMRPQAPIRRAFASVQRNGAMKDSTYKMVRLALESDDTVADAEGLDLRHRQDGFGRRPRLDGDGRNENRAADYLPRAAAQAEVEAKRGFRCRAM